MRKLIITGFVFIISMLTVFFAACGGVATSQINDNANKGTAANGADKNATIDSHRTFWVDYTSDPGQIQAGQPAALIFTVKDQQGSTVKDLQIVHEQPMHVLIVSRDLAEFYHVHPEQQAEDGSYRVQHTFPNGGDYTIYTDFTPKAAVQVVEQINVKVAGSERPKVSLVADKKFENTVGGLRVVMKPSAEIKAGQELTLNFHAFDAASGQPATDLQNYLGELAHFVIISQDLKEFVHAHPMSKAEHADGGHDMNNLGATDKQVDESKPHSHDDKNAGKGSTVQSPSEISAHTTFPKSGLFKIFAQFQRAGKVITVPFIVDIKEGAKAAIRPVSEVQFPADAKRVILSKDGYEPDSVVFQKGEAMKIAFYRSDEENCGGEVVFKDLKITKKLPVGEVVVVDLSDLKSNEVSFACGMNMYKGKVSVQ
ncbi:MAG: cupredoxin domain-containing protein [Pyrinomonadaceae bacterium]